MSAREEMVYRVIRHYKSSIGARRRQLKKEVALYVLLLGRVRRHETRCKACDDNG